MTESIQSSKGVISSAVLEGSIRVLHVDDDPAFLKVAKQCLDTQGEFEVDTASSVNEALEKLKKKDYDAIVSDYQMPGKDGLEFLKELREKGNTVPFIVFTGKGREEIAVKALNLGADQYIDKHGDPETVYCELAYSIRVAVERKKVAEALFAERDRLETVTRSIGAGLALISKDYRTLWANDVLKQIFGDVEGKICYSTYNQRNDICPKCGVQEILETGKAKAVHEQVGKDVDGKIIWSEITATSVKDRDGNITAALELVVPITQRKKAEDELRDSAEKYRSLFANMLDGYAYCKMIFDGEGKPVDFAYLEVNDAFEKLTGLKKEDVIGKKVTETILGTEIAHPELFDIYGRVASTGKEEKFEIFFKPLNTWLSVSVYSPKKGYFIAVFDNITERKKVEEALRASEEKHRVISGITADSVFSCVKADEEGFAIDWMEGATEKVFGYSAKEIRDEGCWKFTVQPQDLPIFEEKVAGLKPGQTSVCELRITHKDGSTRWIKASSQVVKDGSNPTQHRLFGACEDITERKKMEEEIESLARFPSENPNPVLRISQDLRILFANDAGKALLEKLNCEKGGSVPTFLKNLTVETLNSQSRRREESEVGGRIYGFYATPIVDKGYVNVYVIDITERRKAQDILKESEAKYRVLVEQLQEGVIVAQGSPYHFVYANPAFAEMLGYTVEELTLLSPEEFKALVHPEDRETVFSRLSSRLEDNAVPSRYQIRLVKKDGTVVQVETCSKRIVFNGKPSVQVSFVDATERKRTEEALLASETKWRSIAENSPDHIMLLDRDAKIRYINHTVPDLTTEKVLGKSMYDYVPFEFHKVVADCIENVLETGKPSSYITEYHTKEGEIRHFDVRVAPVFQSGKVVGLISNSTDITEGEQAEEKLKSSEQKFRGLVEDSGAAIATTDLKGRLTYLNKALADSLGYSVQEMSGRAFKDFLHPDDRGRLVRLFLKIIVLRRQPWKFEFRALRKDGAILHLICRPTRLETAGKTGGFQAILIDNSAEKRMLEKVEKINEKLSVVGGLTRHDVNNKLSTILNTSYLLKQRLHDNQSLELVKETESAVHQIEGLFEFARTYEKLGTEELAYFDAEKVFKEAAVLFPSLQDIKIVNDCHGLTVFADSLLRQLFYNLVDNSLKHGEKLSRIRVFYEEKNDHLNMIYEDDGVGIPHAAKPKLFGEGYAAGKGSGYGLYLVKKMMEIYGWNITEKGESGKGAKFIISIPRTNRDGKENYRLH